MTFGQGFYQQTIIFEAGKSKLRGAISAKRQRIILENPQSNTDFNANAFLRTSLELNDNLDKLAAFNAELGQLNFSREDHHLVSQKSHLDTPYYSIDLNEFAVSLATSQTEPDKRWIVLVNQEEHIIGHICFYRGQITIVSMASIAVSGREYPPEDLFVYTLAQVLLDESLKVEHTANIFCSSLMLDAVNPNTLLLEARSVNCLCFKHYSSSTASAIKTHYCEIKAGSLVHKGMIEADQSTRLIAESASILGAIAVRGVYGICIITCLGIQTHAANPEENQSVSHLHAGMIQLIADYGPNDHREITLRGLLSCRGLLVSARNIHFAQGKNYLVGNGFCYAEQNMTVNESVAFNLKGQLFIHSKFASQFKGCLTEMPGLDMYFKNILDGHLTLSMPEQKRIGLPRVLVHQSKQPARSPLTPIALWPVLPPTQKHGHTLYDKTRFLPLEIPEFLSQASTANRLSLSAEYMSLTGKFELSLTQIQAWAQELMHFSSHISAISWHGLVDVSLRSKDLDVQDAVMDTGVNGQLRLEATRDMEITNAYLGASQIDIHADNLSFPVPKPATAEPANNQAIIPAMTQTTLSAAGKIRIKSHARSDIPKGSKLILNSPLPVTWACHDFYLRGSLEFEQLAIEAEHVISVLLADMKGKNLDMDATYVLSLLSRFRMDKNFSIKSVVSIIVLGYISCLMYSNTAIAGASIIFCRPSGIDRSAKSFLSCSLAATNTLISILQLAIQDPTTQVALAITRFGINAIPALYQAHQLVNTIHSAQKNPKLSRGQLISLANQTKTLLLCIGLH